MNALLTVLRKAVIIQFYRQNAGLFFVVLMLAGSFLRAGDHIALAEAATHSTFMTGLYQTVWLTYTLFATHFAVDVIRKTEVLYYFRLIPAPRRWLGLLIVQFALLSPVLIYMTFVGWISGTPTIQNTTWQLLTGGAFMLIIPPFWLDYALRTPNRQSLNTRLGIDWHERFTTPYPLFFSRYLIKNQPVLLFLTKSGTCLVMLGVLNLYPTDDYDIRLLALGALLMGVGHSTIGYHLYQFEHERLTLIRNLPIPNVYRLLNYALTLTLLLLPEAIILLRYQPATVSIWALVSVWVFGQSLCLLQYTLLLIRHRTLDQLMPVVSGVLLIFFLGIMYQLPAWGLALMNWTVATILFTRFYGKSVWLTETHI